MIVFPVLHMRNQMCFLKRICLFLKMSGSVIKCWTFEWTLACEVSHLKDV